MRFWAKVKDVLGEMLAPSVKCLACGNEIFDEVGFCRQCAQSVVLNDGKTCKRCGVGVDGAEDYCGYCSFTKVYFDKAYSPLSYEGATQTAILQLKYGNKARYAKVLSRYLAYTAQTNRLQFDLVCYVPMTKKSIKARGYNQSRLLATYFCDIIGKDDCLVDALEKVKETARQEDLGRKGRLENLKGCYKVVSDVKGKRVLVVDDIKTTGATLNECAKVLKRAGATSVVGLTVASRKEKFTYELQPDEQNDIAF